MKQCPQCSALFSGPEWRCPKCQWEAVMIDGYPAFAPEMARQSNGYPAGVHKELVHLEGSYFWFRGRNKILQFALDRYFPSARNLFEIGCGSGFVLSGFAGMRPEMHLVGADIYISGLKFARDRVPRAEFLQMNAYNIPYVDEFDVVGAFEVLEHIDDDRRVLSEIFKAVKQNGGVIIGVPQYQWLWSVTDEFACHKRRYSRPELKAKVEAVGFRVYWITSFVTLLLPLMLISRFKYKIGLGKNTQESVLKELKISAGLNAVFEKIGDLERAILRYGISLPAGGSLLCVGVKE